MTRRYTGGFLSATEQVTDVNSANGVYTLSDTQQLVSQGVFPTGSFTPTRSIRYRQNSSCYMGRTPSVAGDRRTWTWSGWVKRGARPDLAHMLFTTGTAGSSDTNLFIDTDQGLVFTNRSAMLMIPSMKFRDTSAWYHIVAVHDSTNVSPRDRARIYVNGQRVVDFSTQTYPALNEQSYMNMTNAMYLGTRSDGYYFDGYMSEVNFIDGQALDASYFGLTDAETGSWIPKRYTGTYGTNGFYQNYSDATAGNTSGSNAGIGKDLSGNGNYFNTNAFSVSGSTYDVMVDVPGIAPVTNQPDIGGVQRGNYAVMNFNDAQGTLNLYDGGLRVASGSSSSINGLTYSTLPLKGKSYHEVYVSNYTEGGSWYIQFGISAAERREDTYNAYGTQVRFQKTYVGAGGPGVQKHTILYVENGVETDLVTNPGIATGDTFMFAYDDDTRKVWVGKNGTWYLSGNPYTGANPIKVLPLQENRPDTFAFYAGREQANSVTYNFGQRPFVYTPPAGFKSVCTTNLPNPAIKRPSEHFDVKTWIGNGKSLELGTTAKQASNFAASKSLRYSGAQYLARSPSSAGNRRTWTYSVWFKKTADLNVQPPFINAANTASSSHGTLLRIYNDCIQAIDYNAGGYNYQLQTPYVYADASKWHNIVYSFDTTKSIAAERVKIYLDGVRVTTFSTASYPSQNYDTYMNAATTHYVGAAQYGGSLASWWDGYLTEQNLIDGQQLDPTSFGQFDVYGNWVPKAYTGTYGTNGWYLNHSAVPELNTTYANSFTSSQSQYLTVPANAAFNYGSGDFTIEAWIMPKTANQTGCVFAHTTGGNNYGPVNMYFSSGALTLYSSSNGSSFDVASGASIGTPTPGLWSHVAVSRSGNSIRCFLNGVLQSTTTTSATLMSPTGAHWIGGRNLTGGNEYFNGWISNYRVVKGTGLYTANFIPPTSNLTAISGTSVLTCQSSTIVDNGPNTFTITNGGSVAVTPNVTPFINTNGQTPSIRLNGTNQFLSVASSSGAFQMGTGDFTVECWVFPTSLTATVWSPVSTTLNNNTGSSIYGVNLNINENGTVQITGFSPDSSSGVRTNSWNHVAYSRSGTTGRVFINGALALTWTDTTNYNSNDGCLIGKRVVNSSDYYGGAGLISNVRIVKGTAVYTSAFTPSYTNLTAISGTSLLTCQDFYPVDRSTNNFTVTNTNSSTFEVTTALSTALLAQDSSGNKNHFAIGGNLNTFNSPASHNNYDLVTDVPSDYNSSSVSTDTGLTVKGNYAVLDVNNQGGSSIYYGGTRLLGYFGSTAFWRMAMSSLSFEASSSNFYAEVYIGQTSDGGVCIGIAKPEKITSSTTSVKLTDAVSAIGIQSYLTSGNNFANNTSFSSYNGGVVLTTGDIWGIHVNNGTLTFYRNGVSQGVAANNLQGQYAFVVNTYKTDFVDVNFGGRAGFTYTPPSGAKSLNTKNLKDVGSYNLPDTYGNYLNTPDLVTIKCRNNNYRWQWLDTSRGGTNPIFSSDTDGSTSYNSITSFNPNGVTLNTESGVNGQGYSFLGYMWNKGKLPGFDIVTWSGTGASQKIKHQLGAKPAMMIVKATYQTAARNWAVYHKSNGGTYGMYLQSTSAGGSESGYWNNTEPDSSYITLGGNNDTNGSGQSYVGYLWSEVPGFSKFGFYAGNGSSEGPFVNCGFRPRWIMVKSSAGNTSDWYVYDTNRLDYNGKTVLHYFNYSGNEGTTYDAIDVYANGFKLKTSNASNTSGGTYIYAAFAETPLKYANAR